MVEATTTVTDPAATLQPVVFLHNITSKVEALSPATIKEVQSKVGLLRGIRIVDATSLAAADDAYTRARKLMAAIEEQREQLKAPVLELGRAIDAAAKPPLALLKVELAKARAIIDGWNEEQKRKHEAEQRRLREEAEARERAEHARLQAELKRREEERAAAAAAATELNDLFGEEVAAAPPEPEPPPVTQMARPIAKPAAAPAPMLSSAVTSRVDYDVQIDSPAEVPLELEGEQLVEFKLGAMKRLMLRGVKIAGARLVPKKTTTTRA